MLTTLRRVLLASVLTVLAASPLAAQGGLGTGPHIQLFDNSGNPLNAGKVYTYTCGTTTPLATYSDSALSVANANPTVLDSAGRATIYLSPTCYKFRVDTSADATLYTIDNVAAVANTTDGLASLTDVTIQVDTDNNGTNKVTILDGADTEKARIEEDGDIQADGSLTLGDATEADKALIFDGNAFDFYTCLDDSADDLVIGVGNTCGTSPAISITDTQATTIHSNATLQGDVTLNAASSSLNFSGVTGPEVLFSAANGRVFSNSSLIFGLDKNNDGSGEGWYFRNNNATDVFTLSEAGIFFVNDGANANMTTGITVNQGAADNEIVALKSSDVAHGITAQTETDTFAAFAKASATQGGLLMSGLRATGASGGALYLRGGTADAADTTKGTAATAPVLIEGGIKSGTDLAAIGANGNILAVLNWGTTRFILDGDGDSHQDVGTAWTNFDSHDDAAVLNSLAVEVARPDDPYKDRIRARFASNLDALVSRDELQRIGLVQFNADGHHFVNMSKLTMLNVGAIRQTADKAQALQVKLDLLEQDNERLRLAVATLQADLQRMATLEAELRAIRAVLAAPAVERLQVAR